MSPMEKSSQISRYLFGNVYKVTVPSARHIWEWPLPAFLQSDPDGSDGRKRCNTRACHKPHAVIANGAALQRVPGSLRLLQKYCKDANVPLFVIHDPRVWGGNTHQTLQEALKDMRATIKNRVITQALKHQGSSAFARGRLVGQFETEAKWQLKDQTRKARKFLDGEGAKRRKSEEARDWSQLDAKMLEKRLIERRVIEKKKEGESESKRVYTRALVDIARQCVKDVEDRTAQNVAQPHTLASSTTKEATSQSSTVNV